MCVYELYIGVNACVLRSLLHPVSVLQFLTKNCSGFESCFSCGILFCFRFSIILLIVLLNADDDHNFGGNVGSGGSYGAADVAIEDGIYY